MKNAALVRFVIHFFLVEESILEQENKNTIAFPDESSYAFRRWRYVENKLPSTTRLTKEISVPAIHHIEESTLYYYSLVDKLEKFDVFLARTCALLHEDI